MITNFRFSSLLIFLLISFHTIINAQIEKSDKIIFILGKKYYLHEVKKGQTLFSISNAYNVNVQDIINENEELANGKLKVGFELKIPSEENSSKITNQADQGSYIFHTVEKKQTLYYLCNKYNVEEAELIKLNPEIKQGLKVGQVIKVPKPGSIAVEPDKDVVLHTVQPGETLFSLAQRYGCDINLIKSQNPQILTEGLRIGLVLRIPKSNLANDSEIKNETIVVENNPVNYDHLYFEEPGVVPCDEFKYNNNIKFKVAVMLPLSINENLLQKNTSSYYKNTARFYEFYNGLLLAAKRLKENDISVEFYVNDTRANATTTREILSKNYMKEVDLIIGPVYSDNFRLAGDFARENKINIVAPFKLADNNVIVTNPFVFSTNPGDETEIEQICKYIAGTNEKNIIAIHNGTQEERNLVSTFKNKLVNSFSALNNENDIVFKEIDFKSQGVSGIEDALSVGMENLILVPSKDEVFITNVATKMNYLAKKYRITIFGMQSWEQFRNIELEYLKNLKFHYCTTSFVDKNHKDVKNFDYQYKAYFKNDPSIYSYLGYDVTMYFITELKNYGKLFQFCISGSNENSYNSGLRFDFNFMRTGPNGGFENNWIRIVEIDQDFNLVRVK